MLNKRTAIIILLTMILAFIGFVLSWLSYNQNGKGSDEHISTIEKKIQELEMQVTQTQDQLHTIVQNQPPQNNEPRQPEQPVEPEQPATPNQPAPEKVYRTTTSNVNLRADGDIRSHVVRRLPKGAKLVYLDEERVANGYTWLKVKDDGNRLGWIASKYVK